MNLDNKFTLVEWSEDLDLSDFYAKAAARGFDNNSSQKALVDCFKNEREFNVWILYLNGEACGSVACHTLDLLGPNAYRICARTCMLTEYRPISGLLTKKRMVHEFQHITPQLYMPANIAWAGTDKDLYISSNDSPIASQRLVHKMWCPEMERIGLLTRECELEYRGHIQTFWKLNTERFLTALSKTHQWNQPEPSPSQTSLS
jgi:hypothetical protein